MVASSTARAEFIKQNTNFIAKYNTAGVDLDSKYPTAAGPGYNDYSPDDITNYLTLIKELRTSLNTLLPQQLQINYYGGPRTPMGRRRGR